MSLALLRRDAVTERNLLDIIDKYERRIRTLEERILNQSYTETVEKPVYNVKKHYGASQLSSAASWAAISNAIYDASSAGGGTVYLPEMYPLYPDGGLIELLPGVEIIGNGYSSGLDGRGLAADATKGYLWSASRQVIGARDLRMLGDGVNNMFSLHACDNLRVLHCYFEDDTTTANNIAAVRIKYTAGIAEDSIYIEIAGNYYKVTNLCILTQGNQTGPSQVFDINIHDQIIDGTMDAGTFGAIKIDVQTHRARICDHIIDGKGNIEDAINIQEDVTDLVCTGHVIYNCLRTGILLAGGQGVQPVENADVGDVCIINIAGSTNGDSYGIKLNPATADFQNMHIHDFVIVDCQETGIGEASVETTNLSISDGIVAGSGAEAIYIRSDYVRLSAVTVSGAATAVSVYINASATGTLIGDDCHLLQVNASGLAVADNGVGTRHRNEYLPLISVWEKDDYWSTEIVLTGGTLTHGAGATTFDTGIDVAQFGTAARGAYKAFGVIVAGSSSSVQHHAVFECSMRMTDAATVAGQAGSFLQSSDANIFSAVTLDTDLTSIQIKLTNAHASIDLDNMMIHVRIYKTDNL